MSLQLAAVWVKEHNILGTIGVNLGGAYLYHFEEKEDCLHISRRENSRYIKEFYSEESSSLNLVSCIVGKNGSGKTTLLSTVRSILKHGSGFGWFIDPYTDGVLIFENDSQEIIIKRDSHYRRMGFEDRLSSGQKEIQLKFDGVEAVNSDKLIETVYYSPFLSLKDSYNDVSSSPDIDVSLDYVIQTDGSYSDPKGSKNVLLEHKYQNIFRQIRYQEQAVSNRLKLDAEIPAFKKIQLEVRKVEFSAQHFDHTPEDFRPFYEKLYELWKNEIYATSRRIDKDTPLEEDKRIHKLWVLLGILNSLFRSMETRNRFLEEGKMRVTVDELTNLSLQEALIVFLENHYFIKFKDTKLPKKEIQNLIEVIFKELEPLSKGDVISPEVIVVDFDQAIRILDAHKKFLAALFDFNQKAIGFLDVKIGLDLSAGEKAYLDLFSRILLGIEEIDQRLIREDSPRYEDGKLPNHYLLLIDEGDMGFHPSWKKEYVDTLITVLPKLFEKYQNSTIQIIITTHEGLVLSDMPNPNVIYLEKQNGEIKVLDKDTDHTVPKHSFGANISELYAKSFFLSDGLVGNFAKKKINKTISWLIKNGRLNETEYHQKVIELIDEPIIQTKLAEMFAEKTGKNIVETKILQEQIARLQSKLDDLNSPS